MGILKGIFPYISIFLFKIYIEKIKKEKTPKRENANIKRFYKKF
jgi:hypothetical protein